MTTPHDYSANASIDATPLTDRETVAERLKQNELRAHETFLRFIGHYLDDAECVLEQEQTARKRDG